MEQIAAQARVRRMSVARFGVRRVAAVVVTALALLLVVSAEDRPAAAPAVAAIAAAAPAAVPVRIMPLGASSTEGIGSPATGGYRGLLQTMLGTDGIVFDFVGSLHQADVPGVRDPDHEGHSGWTIAQMKPLVRGWIRAQHPDVVLLHVGTNDMLRNVSPAETARQLGALLDDIAAEAPDAHVIVAGVWAPMPQRIEFARQAAVVVAAQQAKGRASTFVDTSGLLQSPGEFIDGLHANPAGYRKIARMWEKQIRAALPPTR
ncbi:GDSL-type esterase/lipase family protein [Pseudonocardia sp. GCM10023141]|uniref:GDSL-type esterase/lipase family protein n=1 Tax=Pseudonocardia sp. GCM10023141 TaxID=3252653 RepID=UPI00360FDCC9